jgi:hypothetical protein
VSVYTTEVRYICEEAAGLTGSVGYASVNDVLAKAAPKVFDFDFPIYDEDYRLVLETKILKHYYTREIGAETVGLWKLWLDAKMNEIMPFYNKLYASALIEFDPMADYEMVTQHTGSGGGTTKDEGSSKDKKVTGSEGKNVTGSEGKNVTGSEGKNVTDSDTTGKSSTTQDTRTDDLTKWQLFSDTPQGNLGAVKDMSYLTNATQNTDTGTVKTVTSVTGKNTDTFDGLETGSSSVSVDATETTKLDTTETTKLDTTETTKLDTTVTGEGSTTKSRTVTSTDEYVNKVKGKRSTTSYSELLEKYRKTLLNIDMMIIGELSELFMGLW